MTDERLDQLAKFAVDFSRAGGKVEIKVIHHCRKCGGNKPYRSNPSPNWMNRWTCPDCGRHESR